MAQSKFTCQFTRLGNDRFLSGSTVKMNPLSLFHNQSLETCNKVRKNAIASSKIQEISETIDALKHKINWADSL